MKEKQFEEILCRYPELLEEGLTLHGRQVRVRGKIVDLLFKDRYGQKLIVELKQGPIRREHIAQLLDYEGDFSLQTIPQSGSCSWETAFPQT